MEGFRGATQSASTSSCAKKKNEEGSQAVDSFLQKKAKE
jgi:hypothetical protein